MGSIHSHDRLNKRNSILNVLNKIFILPFFTRIAGFLFLFLYFLVGIATPPNVINFHKGLIIGLISDPFRLLGLLLFFLFFYARLLHHSLRFIKKPSNEFFLLLAPSFEPSLLRQCITIAIIFMSSPVWLYSIGMLYMAIIHNLWIPFLSIFFLLLSLIVGVSWILRNQCQVGNATTPWTSRAFTTFILKRKPFNILFLYNLLLEKGSMLLIGKSLSLALVISSLQIVKHYSFDLKLPLLFWTISVATQSMIVLEIHDFESKSLDFLRNMPFSLGYRFIRLIGKFLILTLPEIGVFLLFTVPSLGIFAPFLLILFGVGLLLSFYTLLYLPQTWLLKYHTWVILLFAILVLMNLYTLWLLMVILVWIIPIVLFSTQYYGYEWKAREESE